MSTTEKKLKYRGGNVYFQETGREVPYLLVPSGATHTGDEQKRLLMHMRSLFKLDETFFTEAGPCPPNVILRVTPGEDLSRSGAEGTHNLSVASPTRRSRSRRSRNDDNSSLEVHLGSTLVDDSVEVGRDDDDEQAIDCLSKAIGFVQEYKGCFITSADRTTGTVSFCMFSLSCVRCPLLLASAVRRNSVNHGPGPAWPRDQTWRSKS